MPNGDSHLGNIDSERDYADAEMLVRQYAREFVERNGKIGQFKFDWIVERLPTGGWQRIDDYEFRKTVRPLNVDMGIVEIEFREIDKRLKNTPPPRLTLYGWERRR